MTGIDIDPLAVESSKKVARLLNSSPVLLNADPSQVPIQNFDLILVCDIVFPVSPLDDENIKFLSSIQKNLSANGTILIETYNKNFAVKNGIEEKFKYDEFTDNFISNKKSIRLYDHSKFIEILNSIGLKGDRVAGWKGLGDFQSREINDPADFYLIKHKD